MALKQATRGAQPVMSAEFDFSFNDTMKDVNGVTKTFGSVYTDAGVFEVINLPLGAVVIGGDLIVEEQGVGPTAYTAAVGTSGSASAFLAATTLLSAAGTRVALTGLGLAATDGKNVRVTIASTVANATAGKFRLRLEYVIDGRVTEVNPN
ncbi:hypothetical protein DBR23_02625 [Acidovorax sp. HMWF018]|uniref:hypothetical protein n=1 Tax=Acidovorax sp. HMWF018 TaxID=2056855 RepID=UPI000D3409D8|nr:hypothetical protein [Acidovorax sp. HMWF018]PTT42796.1 hypothetical protein DBR23_02625 [Acidovorax sp. HMWF018]